MLLLLLLLFAVAAAAAAAAAVVVPLHFLLPHYLSPSICLCASTQTPSPPLKSPRSNELSSLTGTESRKILPSPPSFEAAHLLPSMCLLALPFSSRSFHSVLLVLDFIA